MSLSRVVGEDFPRGFWMLGERSEATSPVDSSGYSRNAFALGTPSFGPALVKGASVSFIVGSPDSILVLESPSPVLTVGKEHLSFTVEAFVRKVVVDPEDKTEQQILGNYELMDGLVLSGTKVSFVTKYANSGEARASFDVLEYQSMHVVGIHTHEANTLYINGEQVSSVKMTPEQLADSYLAPPSPGGLVSGWQPAGTPPNRLMVNGIGIYDTILDDSSIDQHFDEAQDVLPAEDVGIDHQGALLEFTVVGQLSPLFQMTYTSDEEWNRGVKSNVHVRDGSLFPILGGDFISTPGYWQTVVPLGSAQSQVALATLTWTGSGAIVSTSRDGETYEVAERGKSLATVPKGTTPAEQFLFIKVEFLGGVLNDASIFEDLVFSLYTSTTIPSFAGREVILDKVVPQGDYDPIDYHENWGAELNSGTITIKSSPSIPTAIQTKTVEVWMKSVGGSITSNLSGHASTSANYSNGEPDGDYQDGVWQLRHYVSDSGYSEDIVFSGTGQIGHIILYPESLTEETIREIYTSYTGKPKIVLNVSETFDLHEFSNAVDIYEYDWNIESAG